MTHMLIIRNLFLSVIGACKVQEGLGVFQRGRLLLLARVLRNALGVRTGTTMYHVYRMCCIDLAMYILLNNTLS